MTPTLRAAVWMIGAIVSFTSMAISARAIAGAHDTFEMMLYRSILGVVIVLSVAGWAGTLPQIRRDRLGLHLTRNLCHFAGQNLWLFAVTVVPLAQVFALEFTSPLWVIALAPLILGEPVTRTKIIAGALGIAGVWIVTRPDFGNISPGIVAAASAALAFAGSAIFTRLLTRHESITSILFYLTGMQAVFGLICAGYDGVIAAPTATTWPWLVVIGLAGLVAHFCMTKALTLAPASVVMPIDFVRLPIIAIVGMTLYGEALDALVFVGGAIIFLANWINIRSENRLRV